MLNKILFLTILFGLFWVQEGESVTIDRIEVIKAPNCIKVLMGTITIISTHTTVNLSEEEPLSFVWESSLFPEQKICIKGVDSSFITIGSKDDYGIIVRTKVGKDKKTLKVVPKGEENYSVEHLKGNSDEIGLELEYGYGTILKSDNMLGIGLMAKWLKRKVMPAKISLKIYTKE